MDVIATEAQTVIDMRLTRPAGKLKRQRYRFTISPIADDACRIEITHELCAEVAKRRAQFVNRIIGRVTTRKVNESIATLTPKMANCVQQLALRSTSSPMEGDRTIGETFQPADRTAPTNTAPTNTAPTNTAPVHDPPPFDLVVPDDSGRMEKLPRQGSSHATAPPSSQSTRSTTTPLQDASSDYTPPVDSTEPADIEKPTTKMNALSENPQKPSAALSSSTDRLETESASKPTTEIPQRTSSQSSNDPEPAKRVNPEAKPAGVPMNAKVKPTTPKTPKPLTMRIKITGVRSKSGELLVGVYNSKTQYKKFDSRKPPARQGKLYRQKAIKVSQGDGSSFVCEFTDIPAGSYGVAVFHDQDGNRRLNANFLGMPSEPYGFSNGVRGTVGPPKYESVVFQFDESQTEFTVPLK